MRSFTSGMYNRRQFAPPPADYVDVRVLAAAAPERHTIPAGAAFVVFSCSTDFYVRFGDVTVTAAVPAGDVTDGSGSELNPEAREIPSGTTHISLISAAGAVATLSFFGT